MHQYLKLLGFPVVDAVTGFKGVVTSITFDLYGCVQALVTPKASSTAKDADGALSRWFDTKRLTATAKAPVMSAPTFASVPGPEAKPAQRSMPTR
jgi:hypothetical protein